MQLDNCRQELEKSTKAIRDYEQKVLVLERYLQHQTKEDNKTKRKQQQQQGKTGSAATPPVPRGRSPVKPARPKSSKEKDTTPTRRKSSKTREPTPEFRRTGLKRDILDVNHSFKIIDFSIYKLNLFLF